MIICACVDQTLGTAQTQAAKIGTTVVLHVGPPKTGSSTVQIELYLNQSLLNLDGWKYLNASQIGEARFDFQISNVAACYQHTASRVVHDYSDASCSNWHEFLAQLTVQPNERLVMSSESFAHVDGDGMSQLASDLSPFTTIIVMVYRPFYDWIASVYRQTGATNNQSFETWLTDERMDLKQRGFTTSVYKRYASAFSDVRVHTLGPSLMSEIACDDLEASTTCAAFQKSDVHSFNSKAASVPRECLNAHRLQKLENISIDLHREAFGLFSRFPKSDFDKQASTCFGNPPM